MQLGADDTGSFLKVRPDISPWTVKSSSVQALHALAYFTSRYRDREEQVELIWLLSKSAKLVASFNWLEG